MPATATVELRYTDRAAINCANSQHSTGPRTETGKQRSSQNAIRHGLTARSAVLASEDQAAYENHCCQFQNEYQPATPTETQLVQQLADTSWRLNRIPILEAALLAAAPSPESPAPSPQSLVPQLAALGLHSSRLSRQFQKTLDQLRTIQSDRKHQERRDLRNAAELLELHNRRGIPWHPADHGFVFSKEQVERHDELLMHQNEARHCAWARYEMPPTLMRSFIE